MAIFSSRSRLTPEESSIGANPVSWNDTLAQAALNWASRCIWAEGGGDSLGAGENIADSGGTPYAPDPVPEALLGWSKEQYVYDFSNPSFSTATGHFTQMVWKATNQIGCANVTCPMGTISQTLDMDFVVCEYHPRGE